MQGVRRPSFAPGLRWGGVRAVQKQQQQQRGPACNLGGDGGEGDLARCAVRSAARSRVSRALRSRSSASLFCAVPSASFWNARFICAARSLFRRSIGVSFSFGAAGAAAGVCMHNLSFSLLCLNILAGAKNTPCCQARGQDGCVG